MGWAPPDPSTRNQPRQPGRAGGWAWVRRHRFLTGVGIAGAGLLGLGVASAMVSPSDDGRQVVGKVGTSAAPAAPGGTSTEVRPTEVPETSSATSAQPTTVPPTTAAPPTMRATTTIAPTTVPPAPVPPTIGPPATTTVVPMAPGAVLVTVVDVVDGDTVALSTGERVRVIGIDTPERGEPCYAEASTTLAGLVLGRVVEVTPGAVDDRDRYGRLLRYLDVDGVDAGKSLIDQGLAIARYDSRDGYGPHPREAAYVAADAASPPACQAPGAPVVPTPVPAPVPPPAGGSCDPSYPDVCIPPAPPDLDCGDIPHRRFRVLPPDPHRFDGNRDGVGCERG